MPAAVITGVGALVGEAMGYAAFSEMLFRDAVASPRKQDVRLVGFDPKTILGGRGLIYLDACSLMGSYVAAEALADASLTDRNSASERPRIGTVVSCNLGVLQTVHRAAESIRREGSIALQPALIANASPNVSASRVAIRHGLHAPNITVANGFSSGLDALFQADLCLRAGRADAVLVVGVEELCAEVSIVLRAAMTGSSTEGLVLGEGAAALVVETPEHASRRGARLRGRIISYGQCQSDGSDGPRAIAEAVRASCERVSIRLEENDLILSAECGVARLREVEAAGFEAVLGRSGAVPRAALKSCIGETYGAGGVFQAVAAVACLERGRVFASPASWRYPGGFEEVAPLIVDRTETAPRRVLGIAWGPGEQCSAALFAAPDRTECEAGRNRGRGGEA